MISIEHIAITPEQSHRNWAAQKIAEGWAQGPVKDIDKKQHPCLVEYDQLPPQQRIKDELFLSIVKTFRPLRLRESLA